MPHASHRVLLLSSALFVVLALPLPGHAQPANPFDKAALAWKLPWDADWVTSVAFLGNNRVAAGNNLGQILVWELPDKTGTPAPAPLWRLDGHTNVINRLVATPDGRWLISASNDHTVRYWDMQGMSSKMEVVVLNARAIAEAMVKKGKKAPPPVEIKVQVHEAVRVLKGHKDWVLGLALSGDGKLLVSGDDKGEVIAWDRAEGKELRRWKVKGWAWAMAVAPDSKSMIVSERFPSVFDKSRHAGLKLWDPQTGKMQHDFGKEFKEPIAAAAYSPDGKWLAIGRGGEANGPSGKVTLIDPTTGKKIREMTPGHLDGLTDIVFHPDSKHLFSSGRDTVVRVWRAEDGKMLKELGTPRGGQFKDWIHAVAVSPDGRWLAAADMAGQVQVFALKAE